jgi:hypothetical protein
MGEHGRTVAHELPLLVHGRRLLWWWLRWVVDLGLQVGHSVGQVSPGAASGSGRTAAWDPLVLVAVHCLNCCLVLGVSLEADQLLIRTWYLPSER